MASLRELLNECSTRLALRGLVPLRAKQMFCKHRWRYVGPAALYEYDRFECMRCGKRETFSMFERAPMEAK